MLTALRNFFTAPRYEGDPERTEDARTTHRVAIALIGLALFSVPFILRLESPTKEFALYGSLSGLLVWLVTIALVKRGQTRGAKLIILSINTFNLFVVTFATGGHARPTIVTTLFLLALATLLFPRSGAVNYGIIILALNVTLFFLGRIGLVPEPSIPGDDQSYFFIFTFTLVAVASILAISSANARRNMERIRQGQIELRDRNKALNELTEQLEMRVEERTLELEQSAEQLQKRAAQFETIAQLARTINSIQDREKLLYRISQLVSASFGFYHVGLFLLDESRQYAVLSAANSEGGRKMLDRQHKLKVGSQGIVGYVTSTGNPRIALDTGADAVYFDNPDLPETRSEMALPLRVGSVVLGALDVQSIEEGAFSEADVEVLSILADVVSVAIENARLFEESQRVLSEAQSAYGEFTEDAWRKITKTRKNIGYQISGKNIRLLEHPSKGEGVTSTVPIKLRDKVVGSMKIRLPADQQLGMDENDIIQALADRISTAIENAILLEETQLRAAKEGVLSQFSSTISNISQTDKLMSVAVSELQKILDAAEVSFELSDSDENIEEQASER